MCLKCDSIDKKIERLKQLDEPGLDTLSRAMLRADLESLKAEKASIQCDGTIDSPDTDW
jgi:hypothetical protein